MGIALGSFIGLTATITPLSADDLKLSAEEKALVALVDKNFDEQIKFLEKIVNINSGSAHVEGVKAVGDVFIEEFNDIGFDTKWIPMPKEMGRAGHFYAEHKGAGGKAILLIGHLDTVFPKNSPFQKFERLGPNKAKGPGIIDDKGGDVVALYALKAMQELGMLDVGTVRVVFTGDEESTGKPISLSRKALIDAAKKSDYAMNFEGGNPTSAVMARRGASGWSLEVKGLRNHSSGIFRDSRGAGAIFETARILNGFYSYVRGEHGLTFNPGVIGGGTFAEREDGSGIKSYGKTNIIAQTTLVSGGLRFLNEDQKERARDKMRTIVAQNLPHTSAKITFTDSYPAMSETAGTRRLLEEYSKSNQALGNGPLTGFDPVNRGAADISFVAPYVDSIDGLGAWGGGGHNLEEWADLETVRLATKRAVVFLSRMLKK
jgi:glutamate carboxypeptidase